MSAGWKPATETRRGSLPLGRWLPARKSWWRLPEASPQALESRPFGPPSPTPDGLGLAWERDDRLWADEDEFAGCYALRATRQDLAGKELWRLYMALCRTEDGFGTAKSDLGLRPACHRVEDRVDTHVLIAVLAYQVLRFDMYRLESHGDTHSWPTLRQVLATHCHATVHLTLADGTVHRLRKPGRPEEGPWGIYREFGIGSTAGLPSTRSVVPGNG